MISATYKDINMNYNREWLVLPINKDISSNGLKKKKFLHVKRFGNQEIKDIPQNQFT